MSTHANNNGSVYQKSESRYGAPLDYVGEKLHSAVIHAAVHCRDLQESIPQDWNNENLERYSSATLGYALQAFVLLYNQGALYRGEETVKMALAMRHSELDSWLGDVARRGSVLGTPEVDVEQV